MTISPGLKKVTVHIKEETLTTLRAQARGKRKIGPLIDRLVEEKFCTPDPVQHT